MPAPRLTPLAAAVLHVDPAPERVLEIGCGTGEGTLFLAREFPQARVRGVDRSEEMVRAAVAKVGLDPEGRVAFKVGDPGSLPYPDDFFDLVAQIDSRPATAEIARVLRSGGHLVLAVSKLPRGPLRMRPERQARMLARRGFETMETDQVGDGAFYVGRLGGA
jgi:ubiquinone/menaquinone biosynthesis C-methylase UbiE